jgi:hypothetical protein
VDRWRFLILEQDQWVSVALNDWNRGVSNITELSRTGSNYAGDIEFDPKTGRIYHGNSGISSPEIHVTRLEGNTVKPGEDSGTYGTAKQGGGSVTLSVDGSRFYYGKLQVEALDIKHNLRMFPEVIVAASRDLAFGKNAYYHAETGLQVGQLGFETTAYAISRDGRFLWAFNPSTTTVHQYAIEGE